MVVAAMCVVFGHCPRDQVPAFTVDEVVGNHTEPGLTLHPGIAFVSAAVEPVPPLDPLMRPSHPVRHFCPLRNQRFFCSHLRSGLLVERLGVLTRLTPITFAVSSFLVE